MPTKKRPKPKKLKKIHLKHENDRGTIPPYFWQVVVDGKPIDPLSPKSGPDSYWTTKKRAEDMVVSIGHALGIEDTTNAEEWAKKGYEITIDQPAPGTFKNWPE